MPATIHATADVSPKANIGDGTKIWHQAQIREDAEIGERCIIGKNVYIDFKVKIGNGCKVQNNVSIYYPAELQDDVFVGPSVTFTNDLYPRAFLWDESRHTPLTLLKKGSSVGADSVLIGGITLGEYAMVGAGSVVTKSVPNHGLVHGNPARLVGFVCECGHKLADDYDAEAASSTLECPACGKATNIPKADIKRLREDEAKRHHP